MVALAAFLAFGSGSPSGATPKAPAASERERGGESVWRNYDEVFDLALDDGAVVAATNGGLLKNGKPIASPSGLRSIEGLRPFAVALADGRRLRQEGAAWTPLDGAARPRDLAHGVALDPGDPWPLPVPPPGHAYAALQTPTDAFVGTSDGLYRLSQGRWVRQPLPSSLPVTRPNGLVQTGGTFVVGGLGGLFVGRPGAWTQASDDAIRQIVAVGREVWVVHGDGALDKVDPATDRLFPDVLAGNARRPWTSCVGANGAQPLFGGLGGWTERNGNERFPPELKDDVVTALVGRDEIRWVGSQKSGLLRFEGSRVKRWNPGNGLTDTWVTALLQTPSGLIVGTARKGLFRLVGETLKPFPSPTPRVTSLALWQGRLIVGGMDGVWAAKGAAWAPFATQGEETTSIVPQGRRLAITTAAGAYFLTSPK